MVMKHFCDGCSSLLNGPSQKIIKAQMLPGAMNDPAKFTMMTGDSVVVPIMVDVTVQGEYCESCKRALVSNLRLAVDLGPQAKKLGM